jgi:glyoxylase I family protein
VPSSVEGAILHFALRTPDTAAALKRATDAGCEVHIATKTIPIKNTVRGTPDVVPITIAFIKGPDGELVEFFQNEHT